MRWAVVSDIHSNYEALTAVLAALDKERIDRYLCPGDIVGYGAEPDRCAAEVRKLNPVITAGNHDRASVGLFPETAFTPNAKKSVAWTRDNLNKESRQFLKNLAVVCREGEITLVHSSLCRPEEFEYVSNLSSARQAFAFLQTKVCFIGHSHVPLIFMEKDGMYSLIPRREVSLEDGGRYIVNAGSAGQPRDGNPQAAYVIYDDDEAVIEIKRVAYDIARAQEKIIRAGLPEILARRLAAGK